MKSKNVDKAIVITRLTGTLALSALVKLADVQFGESVAYATGFSNAEASSTSLSLSGDEPKDTPKPEKNLKGLMSIASEMASVRPSNQKIDFIRMEFANEANALKVEAKQMDKETALKTIEPYRFTIKNTGTVNFDTNLYLEVLSNTLNVRKDQVKLFIKDGLGNVVFDGNFEEAKELLNKNIRINSPESKDFKVWAWLDAPTDVYKGDIVFKLSAYATQVKE